MSKRRISLLYAFLCLAAFLFPGLSEHLTSDSYLFVLGLIHPGWCRLELNVPYANGVHSGVVLQASWSWLFFVGFVVLMALASKQKTPSLTTGSPNPALSTK